MTASKRMRCVIVKLAVNLAQVSLLDDLRIAFRKTYNQYVVHAHQLRTSNKRQLERCPVIHRLLENTRQCARDVACEAVKSFYEKRKDDPRAQFPHILDHPMATRLNYRDGYRLFQDGTVRISIRKGVKIITSFQGRNEDVQLLRPALNGRFRLGAAVVTKRHGKYYLHVAVELGPVPQVDLTSQFTVVGVDVNEKNVALTAMTQSGAVIGSIVLDYAPINALKQQAFTTRKRLQRVKKVSLVKTIRDKERRQLRDIFHKVSRIAVAWTTQFDNSVLVLEDLTDIREDIQFGKRMNRRLHNWGFRQLQNYLMYKAYDESIPVRTVDPRLTSQMCPVCETAKKSHKRKRRFQCSNPSCRHTDHRDRNAALNVARKGLVSLTGQKKVLTLKKHAIRQVRVVRWLASGLVNSPVDAVVRRSFSNSVDEAVVTQTSSSSTKPLSSA